MFLQFAISSQSTYYAKLPYLAHVSYSNINKGIDNDGSKIYPGLPL